MVLQLWGVATQYMARYPAPEVAQVWAGQPPHGAGPDGHPLQAQGVATHYTQGDAVQTGLPALGTT